MASNVTLLKRLQRELQMLECEPPPGISAWPKDGNKITEIEACIVGAADTPYENGLFKLEVTIPDRYPYEPPNVRFVTPIYHPNIDDGGRICLDTLVQPPKGAWTPSLNISTVLSTIQLLMSHPNPDDPLMADINEVFVNNHSRFVETAKEWTLRFANESEGASLARDQQLRKRVHAESAAGPTEEKVEEPSPKKKRSNEQEEEKKRPQGEDDEEEEDEEEEEEDDDEEDDEESEHED